MLEAQVRRMIADPRADALMTAFTGQWLQLRNLDKVTPDLLLFPDFDDNVRQAFRRETELLLRQHRAREPLACSTLLDADYTFVNERLARHYGIPGVYGSRFRRVPVTDPNRRGLLGQGSILSMTVGGQSHVAGAAREVHHLESAEHAAAAAAGRRAATRGERARRIGRPPCASSSNGTARTRCAPRATATSIRLALRSRTSTPSVSGGRRRGKGWRSTRPACWPTARKSTARRRCARRCWPRPDVFAGTVTEKLLIYALGRGLEPVDMPVVRSIVRNAAEQNYAMQSIVLGIVRSYPFQMRTN